MPLSCAAESASAICRAIVERFVDADAARCDAIRERRSLHQLQHERGRGAGVLDAVDAGDVRMIERGQHTRFALESREPLGVCRERARQDLDRHIAPEARVARAVHLAHAAGTERRHHVVVAQATAGGQPGREAGRRDAGAWTRFAARPATTRMPTGHWSKSGQIGGVGRQQRFDVPAQRFIAGDCGRHERGAFGAGLFDRGFEQPLDTQPSIIGHTRRGGPGAVRRELMESRR